MPTEKTNRVLIVAATEEEVLPLLRKLSINKDAKTRLKKGNYNNIEIDVLITGVGMVATAFWTGKTLGSNTYDLALNLGIAGSFSQTLEIGTVVNVVEDCFSEMGAEDGDSFLSLEELNLEGEDTITNETIIDNKVLEEIPKAFGITVNAVHGNENSIEALLESMDPDVESMEGAAFLFACKHSEIPHAQIRAISNPVERRNKENWNIPIAINNLNKKALEILEAF